MKAEGRAAGELQNREEHQDGATTTTCLRLFVCAPWQDSTAALSFAVYTSVKYQITTRRAGSCMLSGVNIAFEREG
jgi:hypothetical protein